MRPSTSCPSSSSSVAGECRRRVRVDEVRRAVTDSDDDYDWTGTGAFLTGAVLENVAAYDDALVAAAMAAQATASSGHGQQTTARRGRRTNRRRGRQRGGNGGNLATNSTADAQQ